MLMVLLTRDAYDRMITQVEMFINGPKIVDVIFSKEVFVEDIAVLTLILNP